MSPRERMEHFQWPPEPDLFLEKKGKCALLRWLAFVE
jgi:hypothetical protein